MTPFEAELLKADQFLLHTALLQRLAMLEITSSRKAVLDHCKKSYAKDTARLNANSWCQQKAAAVKVGQFAGRAAPLLSAVGNVADVADLITSDDGLDNKLVDAAGMGIGGTLGFVLWWRSTRRINWCKSW